MKDITYWNDKIQKQIDSYPEAVRERINFELVALQSDCPHSFDSFDFPVDGDDALGFHRLKKINAGNDWSLRNAINHQE